MNNNINITVTTNNLDVISSGVVHLTTPDVSFQVDNLKMKFTFLEDHGGVRYEGKVENEILNMKLFNFKNSFGEGNPEPLPIATVKDRQLYMTYYVDTLNGNNMRQFHYTFMLGSL